MVVVSLCFYVCLFSLESSCVSAWICMTEVLLCGRNMLVARGRERKFVLRSVTL